MLKYFINLSLLSIVISVNGMELSKSCIRAPEKLGTINLAYKPNTGFFIKQNNAIIPINNYDVDPLLRCITPAQLQAFLNKNYIVVNQMSNGDFTLKANGRLLGAGPVAGMCAAWIVRGTMYTAGATVVTGAVIASAPIAATTAVVVATAPVSAPAALAASTSGIVAYATTVEGLATGAAILLYACPWLP
jgi:hypothetical protein